MVCVLGVHDGHNATAAVIKDGKLVAAVSEERFNLKKNWSGLPKNSINFCLRKAGISSKELDIVVLASKFIPPTISIYKDGSKQLYYFFKLLKSIVYNFSQRNYEMLFNIFSPLIYERVGRKRERELSKFLGISSKKILRLDHHLAHSYSGYVGSGFAKRFDEFLVISLDGEGDGLSATINIAKADKLERVSKTSNYASIGLLYLEITKLLGLKPLEDEYKVMGLAPYASDYGINKVYPLINNLIKINKETLSFISKIGARKYEEYLRKNLLYKRFDWIAGAIQKYLEELVIKWIKLSIKKFKIKNLVLTGGVFMNVKLNQKILNLNEVENLFVFPSCGDESLATGAAYYGYKLLTGEFPEPLKDLYLGPEYDESEIKERLENESVKMNGLKYEKLNEKRLVREVSNLLAKGEIVGWFRGRMEWGARALGNRSILANPSDWEVVRKINFAIKKRDFWMPFAPSILSEREDKYIINPKKMEAPYMVITFDTTEKSRKEMKAAIHPYDFTVRPQIVYKDWNPIYWRLIKEFEKRTGIGAVLNTSFNLHGYPIVNSPSHALFTFLNSDLKYLVMENFLVEKST